MSPRVAFACLPLLMGGLSLLLAAHPSPPAQHGSVPISTRPEPRADTRGGKLSAEDYFQPDFLRRSADYNRGRLLFALNARGIRWATLLTLFFTPFLPRLSERFTRRFPGRENLRVATLAGTVLLINFAALLPISFAAGFVHEHRFGLSRQSAVGWFWDAVKWLLVSGAVVSLLTVLYFLLRRRMPHGGWAVFAAATVLAVLAATLVFPVVVDPLFNRFHPLEDEALRRDLVVLAQREGVPVKQVLVMEASAKTVRENAYFTGLGRTKRIVLWDNLLANAPPAAVRQVVAHELGHWSRGHIGRGLALSAAAILLFGWLIWRLHARLSREARLRLAGPADPAGIPLVWLLLSLAMFASNPVANAVSRSFEREADRVSLELTGDPRTFIESQRRMAVRNLSWVDPPAIWKWLFGTHPTTLERIRMAETWRAMVAGQGSAGHPGSTSGR